MQGFVYVSVEQNIKKAKLYCTHTDMCQGCYKHSLSLPPCYFPSLKAYNKKITHRKNWYPKV